MPAAALSHHSATFPLINFFFQFKGRNTLVNYRYHLHVPLFQAAIVCLKGLHDDSFLSGNVYILRHHLEFGRMPPEEKAGGLFCSAPMPSLLNT